MLKLRPFAVALIATLLYVLYVIVAFGNPLALVTLGSAAEEAELFVYSDEGYDGQFTYFIARDPSGAANSGLIDVPTYRYQRILLPALGFILSFGQDALLPYSLLLANLLALGTGTWVLEKFLIERGVSRWYALGYALSLGVMGTVRLSLPEPLAYALCLGGLWLVTHERFGAGAILFALALLARETALVFAAGYGFHLLLNKQIRKAILYAVIVLGPFIAWQIVLKLWLGSYGLGSGGAGATGFAAIPFLGIVQIWLVGGPTVFIVLMLLIAPFVLLPTLWGFYRCWLDWRRNQWTMLSSVLLMNLLIMPFIPFSTYREINGILRFIVGLQIAVILYAAQQRNRRVLRYTTFWAITSIILIYSDILIAGSAT